MVIHVNHARWLVTMNTNKNMQMKMMITMPIIYFFIYFKLKQRYQDEDDMLTHESQFAGCGKQARQQSEKTETKTPLQKPLAYARCIQ